jgi:uncharacterized membrane protein YqjE
MAEPTPSPRKGLLESLQALVASLVATAHTRLDLLAYDLDEDRAHFFSLLVFVLAALFFLGVGVVMTSILLVVLFWDTHRLVVLSLLIGFFLTASAIASFIALRKAKSKPKLFAASMSELLKDRQQLTRR